MYYVSKVVNRHVGWFPRCRAFLIVSPNKVQRPCWSTRRALVTDHPSEFSCLPGLASGQLHSDTANDCRIEGNR